MKFEQLPVPKKEENNEDSDNRVKVGGFDTESTPLTIKKWEDMTQEEREAWDQQNRPIFPNTSE